MWNRTAPAPLSEVPTPPTAPEVLGGVPFRSKAVAACLDDAWTLHLLNRATGEELVTRFRCKSWRCPRCAPGVNARDAERVLEGLGRVDPRELVFLTLTLDPKSWASRGGRGAAWKATRLLWKRLRDRLAYHLGTGRGRERRKARIRYVQTWEGHRSGWPHVHAVVHSRELAEAVRARGTFQRVDPLTGEVRALWRWAGQVLRPLAVAAGFGHVVDVQPPRDWGAVGAYLVKLAKELTGTVHKGQLPIPAPRGFRRLRSTPRFLPRSRPEAGDWTGRLLRERMEKLAAALDLGASTPQDAPRRVESLAHESPIRTREPPILADSLHREAPE